MLIIHSDNKLLLRKRPIMTAQNKYNIAFISSLLKEEKQTIRNWSRTFADYLSTSTQLNPKTFNIDDIKVLLQIYSLWEENPDIENIKATLNAKDYEDNPSIMETIKRITPLFQELPEDINEDYPGVLFGGEFDTPNLFETADAYKTAADNLLSTFATNEDQREQFMPALFLYRHALELYMKSVLGIDKNDTKAGHDLDKLYIHFAQIMEDKFGLTPPEYFKNTITEFHTIDEKGTTFRYGAYAPKNIVYLHIQAIKTRMDLMQKSFQNINKALNML